jgi:alpha-ketoglutaric semialdehyde dehydrogenase
MSGVATSVLANVFIGGEWRAAGMGEQYERVDPMHPTTVLGPFASAGRADVDAAVSAAEAAFPKWAALPAARRGDFLAAAADALARRVDVVAGEMTIEMGKPIREARGEVARAIQILRYAAGAALRPSGLHFEQMGTTGRISTRRRPLGVVGLITPWNFPCAIPVWKLAPALMCGNTVVLKLAYEAPSTGLRVAEAFADAGLPSGVFNVLTGRGGTIGDALVRDERVAAISFTGSVATGTSVRDIAVGAGKRVQLELGGHNPLIVMADADVARAVEAAFAGAFWSAGQKCTATRRIYVEAPLVCRIQGSVASAC